jgi:hypothetical protein
MGFKGLIVRIGLQSRNRASPNSVNYLAQKRKLMQDESESSVISRLLQINTAEQFDKARLVVEFVELRVADVVKKKRVTLVKRLF